MRNSTGHYLKTICYVPLARNQDLARTHCANSQTKLLALNSSELMSAVFAHSNAKFISGWILWTDGKNSTGCTSMKKYTTFIEQQFPCSTSFYFYCEYNGKFKILRPQTYFYKIFQFQEPLTD